MPPVFSKLHHICIVVLSAQWLKGEGAELLKLRSGPGLGYKVILGLPDGTFVSRRDCVTEVDQLRCDYSHSISS